MRLRGWIALELTIGATFVAGVSTGAWIGVHKLRDLTRSWEANAEAAPVAAAGASLAPLERALPPREVQTAKYGYFLGVKDEILTAPLLERGITRVKFNRGGSSLSLRLDFEGGARAAFKPDQTNEQTVPRKEIAAYRINRLLGLSSVAPAVPRRFPVRELVDKFDPNSMDILPRFEAEIVLDQDGELPGELSWWIPVITDAKIGGVTIDSPEGMTAWHKWLTIGEEEPDEARVLLPQISGVIVFDYLTNNSDRWSGSNAKASPDMKTLYFMDNTLSFGPVPEGQPRVRQMLEHCQKFSRSLIAHVRGLDESAVRVAVTTDTGPYEQLLTDAEIAAVMYRREQLTAYVQGLIEEHGEDAVLVYP